MLMTRWMALPLLLMIPVLGVACASDEAGVEEGVGEEEVLPEEGMGEEEEVLEEEEEGVGEE